jgi:DNA-binding MarR family transcriptional regulator
MSFDTRLLNGLNVLAAIVEAGNFVRAGEALGLTQSGVSRALQRLEQQLGVRLLDRTPKAVTSRNGLPRVLSGEAKLRQIRSK